MNKTLCVLCAFVGEKRVYHEDTKTTKKKIKLFVNFVPLWEKVAHQATNKEEIFKESKDYLCTLCLSGK